VLTEAGAVDPAKHVDEPLLLSKHHFGDLLRVTHLADLLGLLTFR
jgi:hypothetical protein